MKLIVTFLFIFSLMFCYAQNPWKFESNKVSRVKDNSYDTLISVKQRTIVFDADNLTIKIFPDSMTFSIISKAEQQNVEEKNITMIKVWCIDKFNNKCTIVFGAIGASFYQMLVYYYDLEIKYIYYIYNQIL